MNTREGERIDTLRIQQVQQAGASTLVTSCPYCFHMLKDALKTLNLDKNISIQDITGLLSESRT
jgi:Fe-S oxidoreductase